MVIVYVFAKTDGVVRRTHGKYAGKLLSRNVRYKGNRARGNHQLIVRNRFSVCKADSFCLRVNAHSLHSGPDLHTGETGVLFRSIDNQLLTAFNTSPHIIWQPAARIGNVFSFGINRNLCAAVLPHQLCSGFRAGGNASDNNNIHSFSPLPFLYGAKNPAPSLLFYPEIIIA